MISAMTNKMKNSMACQGAPMVAFNFGLSLGAATGLNRPIKKPNHTSVEMNDRINRTRYDKTTFSSTCEAKGGN
jgi:hypothetical protein